MGAVGDVETTMEFWKRCRLDTARLRLSAGPGAVGFSKVERPVTKGFSSCATCSSHCALRAGPSWAQKLLRWQA